jgi:hypothetical protein
VHYSGSAGIDAALCTDAVMPQRRGEQESNVRTTIANRRRPKNRKPLSVLTIQITKAPILPVVRGMRSRRDHVADHSGAFYEYGVEPLAVAKLSGIGCSSKTPAYFLSQSHGFNAVMDACRRLPPA